MPLPKNDPRRNKPTGGTPPPASGNKPGTGFVPALNRTFRNDTIHPENFPPALEGVHFDDSRAPVLATIEEMERWIPGYSKGHTWKNVDQMLTGLWQARAIPGLTPEEHAQYDGKPTVKEWYLLAFTQDGKIYKAWQRLNSSGT